VKAFWVFGICFIILFATLALAWKFEWNIERAFLIVLLPVTVDVPLVGLVGASRLWAFVACALFPLLAFRSILLSFGVDVQVVWLLVLLMFLRHCGRRHRSLWFETEYRSQRLR
jgi:hypothetical protein